MKVWFNDRFDRDRYPNKGDKTIQGLLNSITVNLDKILATEYNNSIKLEVPDPFVGICQIYARSGKVCGNTWLKAHRWKVIEPAHVMSTFLPELQDTINAKNKKIDEYLKNCDECWLLVVADRTKADQCYYLSPDEMKSHAFLSKFQKTFFLEIAENLLLELTTK